MMPQERIYEIPMREVCRHICYSEFGPLEYFGLVQTVNENTHNLYRGLLRNTRIGRDACVVVVGSDGKYERHAQSRTEFVLVLTHPDDRGPRDRVMETLSANTDRIHLELGPYHAIEVKILNSGIPVSWAFNNEQTIYPDRLLNSTMVLGNPKIFQAVRAKVISEMIDSTTVGKKIRERMKSQLHDYQKAIKTGAFRGIINFDPMNGDQYYCEAQPIQLGFKPAFIRGVQRKFDLAVSWGLRQGRVRFEDIVNNMPSTTVEKFSFFSSHGLFGVDISEKAALSYCWFLQQYHHVQEHYKTAQRPVQLAPDKDLYRYHASVINDFVGIAFK